MEIKTKYNIGQKVYYLQYAKTFDNYFRHKIACAYITSIQIDEYLCISYEIGWIDRRFYENSLFATKKEAEQKLKEKENEK